MTVTQPHVNDPRWRRLPEERPQQILDAALSVFAEHGIAEARLEEIAARAGVSKGTIYLYFPSKEELFREVVRQRVGPLIENADKSISSELSAVEQLKSYLKHQWECLGLADSEGWLRLVLFELHKYPDLAQFHYDEIVTRSNKILSDIIGRGISTGEFRDVDPQTAAKMIKALILMHVIWTGARAPAPVAHRPEVKNVLRNVTDFVLHALRPAATALLIVFALFARQASAQEPVVLTLGGAARLAADKSAAPEAARLRTAQAEARVRQSKAAFLPNLHGDATESERTFNSASFGLNFADPLTGKSLFDPNGQDVGPVKTFDFRATITQSIYDPASFARLKAARASSASFSDEAAAQSQMAAGTAAAVYVRVLKADAQLAARIADSTLAEELLGIARDQLTAGVGIALDVTRAQAQLAANRAQLIAARNERNRARLELHRALGLPLTAPITIADSLTGPLANDVLPTALDATSKAMHSRADLRAADGQIAAAQRQVESIKSERLPSLAAFLDDGPTSKSLGHLMPTYDWGIRVTVPIFDGFRREGRMQEQQAAIQELGVRKRDLTDQAAIDVSGALLDLNSAREELAATEEHLRLSEQELAQSRDRFRSGVTGNAEVVTASLNLNAARTQVVDARAAFQSARVALARAQGIVTELP